MIQMSDCSRWEAQRAGDRGDGLAEEEDRSGGILRGIHLSPESQEGPEGKEEAEESNNCESDTNSLCLYH